MTSPKEEQALKVTYEVSLIENEVVVATEDEHFQWECQSKESNHIETPQAILLIARVEDEQLKSDDWFLDSSCSNHMCNWKECFVNFNEQFVDNVKMGENATLVVKGKGNVRLRINNQIQITAKESPSISTIGKPNYKPISAASTRTIASPAEGEVANRQVESDR
ncbi:hypothetical protein J1N35_042952 [Gossypium stocksii]|uniref:Retrovirus-related Pol polyprotein from transposon TNT 1-94-like beta-barrel domain-containing protein n=1 Tax=Gossypium stocksii TaxID=47602 RepID=A0A9D3U6H2_9ROSI|nr:hypothetical protein J1N35_042952 [Gossypium stocksii]